eukprot:5579498-Heterocapsa_arctica.AAC.1
MLLSRVPAYAAAQLEVFSHGRSRLRARASDRYTADLLTLSMTIFCPRLWANSCIYPVSMRQIPSEN